MNEIEFNKSIRNLNKLYRALFGSIPCIQNFSCSRESYINALRKSVEDKVRIETLLSKAISPPDKDALI